MKKLFYTVLIPILAAGLFAGGCDQKKQEVPAMSSKTLLIDVRSEEEFNSGHHAGAVNIPHTQIAEKISAFAPDKSTPLYLYCRSGRRVGIAIETLKGLGYQVMFNLGGFEEAAAFLKEKRK